MILCYDKVTQITQWGHFTCVFISNCAALNFSAYGLESSRTPSYTSSSSFGAVKISGGPVSAQEATALEYVTKTETKVIKSEGGQKAEQVAQEVTVEEEQTSEEMKEQKEEQKLVEAEE